MKPSYLSYALTSSQIKNALAFCNPEKKFRFIINGKTFEIPRQLIIFISPYVYRLSASQNEFEIISSDIPSLQSEFERLICLVNGTPYIHLEDSSSIALTFISKALRNPSLSNLISKSLLSDDRRLTLLSTFSDLIAEDSSNADFSFVRDDPNFKCSKLLAAYLSPKAAAVSSMEIEPSPAFAAIFDLLHGLTLHITGDSAIQISSIAAQLGNESLFSACVAFLSPSPQSALSALSLPSLPPQPTEADLVSVIASHFTDFPFDTLSSLPLSVIYQALSSPSLRVSSEDVLLDFIVSEVNNFGQSSSSLYKFVKFEFVSSDSMKLFLSKFNPKSISEEVWAAISKRLELDVDPSFDFDKSRWTDQRKSKIRASIDQLKVDLEKEKKKSADLQKKLDLQSNSRTDSSSARKSVGVNKNFASKGNGVFASLKKWDLVKSGIVSITSSSESSEENKAENVIEWNADKKWESKDIAEQWIQFDFGDANITLTQFDAWPISCFPKVWVLEGSADGRNWTEIYRGCDDDKFNTYDPVSEKVEFRGSFRIIRIRALDENYWHEDWMSFRGIEFYGAICAEDGTRMAEILSSQ